MIQDNKPLKDKANYEEQLNTTLIIPLLVALITTIVAHIITRKKYQKEIDKVHKETQKIATETDHLKKSFQPTVIGMLQTVQEKLIHDKIQGLKELVRLRNEIMDINIEYDDEGAPINIIDAEDYNEEIFLGFGIHHYLEIDEFRKKYFYIYSENTFTQLENLFALILRLYERVKAFQALQDLSAIGEEEIEMIEELHGAFYDAIVEIRKDCLLHNNYIQDFIDQNKP